MVVKFEELVEFREALLEKDRETQSTIDGWTWALDECRRRLLGVEDMETKLKIERDVPRELLGRLKDVGKQETALE